jgi:Nucleotidyl transferase AbiEii toxin, Type IV TA system
MKYTTPSAFRQALNDRLSTQAREQGIDRSRLQKRLAFERYLARLFTLQRERFVLKGGYALELRLGDRARATQDLDFAVPIATPEAILEDLRDAADLDLSDFLRYEVSLPSSRPLVGPPAGGYRYRVEARLDGQFPYAILFLDVGMGDVQLNPSEERLAHIDLEFAGLETPSFPITPLPEHFTEKLHAYTRPRSERTRVKDLVDLVLIIGELKLEPNESLSQVIHATFALYSSHELPAPQNLAVPPETWREPFKATMLELQLEPTDALEAHGILVAFLERLP